MTQASKLAFKESIEELVFRDEEIIEYIRTYGEKHPDAPWTSNKEIGDAIYGTDLVEQEVGAARRNSIVSATSTWYKEGTLDIHHKERDVVTGGWNSFYFWVTPAKRVPHPSATDMLKDENERLKAEIAALKLRDSTSGFCPCRNCQIIIDGMLCRPCTSMMGSLKKAA